MGLTRKAAHGARVSLVLGAAAALAIACGSGDPLAPSPAATTTPAPTLPCPPADPDGVQRVRVLVVGDSIAAGSGAPIGSRWRDAMKVALRDGHPDLDVSIVSNSAGGSGLDYAEQQVAVTDLSTIHAAVVIVGINDADEVFDVKTVTEEAYRARYARLLETLGGGGRNVIVATFPPSLTDESQFFESYQAPMAELIREVGGPNLLDLWDVFHEMGPAATRPLYSDNYHPNAEGQALMGQLLATEMKESAALACSTDVSGSPRVESSTTLTSSPNPSVGGEPVLLTAEVRATGGTPTGLVQFQVDGADVGNAQMLGAGGFLSLSVPDLAIGSHAFRAIYAGSNAYRGSASESLEQGVGKVHTTATVTRTAGSDPSLVGDPVVFTVTIAAVQQRGVRPTGTVTFTVDGRVVGEPVTLDAKGEARFTASSLTEGRHVVRAIYSGSERFASVQSANVTQTVN